MKTRIYEVPAKQIDGPVGVAIAPRTYLVEATSQAAAERYVASKYVGDATIATPKRIVELMGDGVKVESSVEV